MEKRRAGAPWHDTDAEGPGGRETKPWVRGNLRLTF
jgi:hypothetical protein